MSDLFDLSDEAIAAIGDFIDVMEVAEARIALDDMGIVLTARWRTDDEDQEKPD